MLLRCTLDSKLKEGHKPFVWLNIILTPTERIEVFPPHVSDPTTAFLTRPSRLIAHIRTHPPRSPSSSVLITLYDRRCRVPSKVVLVIPSGRVRLSSLPPAPRSYTPCRRRRRRLPQRSVMRANGVRGAGVYVLCLGPGFVLEDAVVEGVGCGSYFCGYFGRGRRGRRHHDGSYGAVGESWGGGGGSRMGVGLACSRGLLWRLGW
jgi:hypothetical protein